MAGPFELRGPVVTTPRSFTPETSVAIRRATEEAMRRGRVPGAIVAVQTPAGRFEGAFGVADKATGAPLDLADRVRIGSVTKTMTTTVLLQQVDAGSVDLDSPASTSLPDLPAAWKDVTVRQLARMRSGIPTFSRNPAFGEAYAADQHHQFSSADLLALSEALPMLFAPGTDFDYSNTNTVILGMVIERVTGRGFRETLSDLFTEAGLPATVYAETDAEFPSPRAEGYTLQTPDGSEANSTEWNTSWAQAAGSAVSTVADLETWLRELTSGSLISARSQRARLNLLTIPNNPDSTGYGLGIVRTNGWLGHSGDIPGYSTTMYARNDGSTIVVIATTDARTTRDDGTSLSASAGIAEAVTAIAAPEASFVFPRVD